MEKGRTLSRYRPILHQGSSAGRTLYIPARRKLFQEEYCLPPPRSFPFNLDDVPAYRYILTQIPTLFNSVFPSGFSIWRT